MAVEVLTTVGNGSWTVPGGVTSVQVECWGGGGQGNGGYAGGGGAYAKKNSLAVTPGQSIPYSIGRGGDPSVGGATAATGQPSWFSSTSTVFAEGGTMGLVSQPGASNGKAANSVGDVKYNGGSVGTNGYAGYGGGGSASPTGAGNAGGAGQGQSEAGGSSPGAGAGGASGTPGADNVNGGGGGGGSAFNPGGRGGHPGGGGGAPGNNVNTYGGRGQIRLTYTAGAAVAKRRRSTSLA